MINNPVGIKAEHIAGSSNILADAISRVFNISYSENSFIKKFQDFPQMKSWKRFQKRKYCKHVRLHLQEY